MLAAHRCGGRTDFSSFARAWDRFTGAGSRARSASERELRTLRAQLEASLWREDDARAEVTGATMPPALAPRRDRRARAAQGAPPSGRRVAAAVPALGRIQRRGRSRASTS